jgi:aryl-alcohol dehydrogenase-like predicted oxidoreductase
MTSSLPLPTAPFGSTGHRSTRLIFGAAALGGGSQDHADRVLAQVRAAGINHLDTAASYGQSELRLAPFLSAHRHEVFLATKTGARDGDGARAELERSLVRLGVDRVDLIQLHNLVEDDEWEQAHARRGAVAALAKACEEGLAGAIGVTGHGLRIAGMHRRSLERYPFASVLLPYNASLLDDPGYRTDVEALRVTCAERGVAMQTIKAVARRRWTPDDTSRRFSWYEPLTDDAAIARAVRVVLSQPDLFLNTSSDARLLDAITRAATAPDATSAPSPEALAADVAAFGIEPLFDGAALERI